MDRAASGWLRSKLDRRQLEGRPRASGGGRIGRQGSQYRFGLVATLESQQHQGALKLGFGPQRASRRDPFERRKRFGGFGKLPA